MGFWYSHDFNVYNNYYWHDDPARSVLEASAFHQVVDNVKIYNNYFNVDGGSGVLSLCCGQTFEVYNNIFDCTDAADNQNELVGGGDQPTTWTKVDFYNNTAVGYGMMGYFTVWDESSDSGFYNYKNNILSAPLYRAFNVIVVTGGSEEGSYYDDKIVADYNLYVDEVVPWYYRPTGGGISYDDWKTLTGNDAHSIIDDPEFAGVGNYQLQSTSPAIDAGTDVGVTADYLGNLRLDTPDIGAYEYGASSVDSSLKEIVSYSFTEQTGSATINFTAKTVDIEVAYGTDVTGLIATFTLSEGATAVVGVTAQVSGTTENDFTDTVTYVVTALDETTENWYVIVTVETNPVATLSTDDVTYNAYKASVSGTIYSANGGTLTQRGVCWSTSANPTISNQRTIYTPYVGSFTDVIRGLKGGTTYYFRSYATTSEGGASYGDAITITTPAQTVVTNGGLPPIVNNKPVIVK
ncbi:MAG: hypothetical protein MUC78_13835 [Bacteroidales bacterium]|nr:hypothetical protein [Bacteroidales bacterium]